MSNEFGKAMGRKPLMANQLNLSRRRRRVLHIGEMYFGSGETWLETRLGSCISIVLWFPQAGKGGICHFLLPFKRMPVKNTGSLNGRYGNEAWNWLNQQVSKNGLSLGEAKIKLFGGACSISCSTKTHPYSVGEQNVQFVETLMERAGVQVLSRCLGGTGSRFIRFDLATGDVWVRRLTRTLDE
ncbi:Chemoreceptor glutamine deamidase CheD [compost metagenome]